MERRHLTITRRTFLQGAGALVASAAVGGSWTLEEALAAPPAVPRNTAFLQWIATQTQKPARFTFAVMGDNRPNTKLFDKIATLVEEMKESGTIKSEVQPIVIVVRKKERRLLDW